MSDVTQDNRTFSFNWRQSPAHVWFLTTFLQARRPDDRFFDIDWRSALGEEPTKAVERFRVHGVLTLAPLALRLDTQYKKSELVTLLRESEPGLPTSGNKRELIDRLIRHDEAAMRASTTVELLQCTDYGRSLAEQYLADPQSIIMHVEEATEVGQTERQLSPAEVRRILRWLLIEGIVLGVAGNAAYDLLKNLARRAGEALPDIKPDRSTNLSATVTLGWCFVPAGYFLMGPRDKMRRVYVPSFYIGRFPITNRQYSVFVRASGHKAPSHWSAGRIPRGKSNHPVTNVSYLDVVAFCEWATQNTKQAIRLPTEEEWEKAARGTDGREYPWGSWQSGRCNTSESGIGGTTPVDRYPNGRSPYGAYDMAGNVWERTDSFYDQSSRWRVWRGGSWIDGRDSARAAYRDYNVPGSRNDDVGFRVVRRLPSHPDH